MKLSMLLAPSIWNLLGQLRTHLDVTLDVLDVSLEPLLPAAPDAGHQALRALATDDRVRDDGLQPRSQFAAAIRTGHHQHFDVDGLRIGAFPLRHDLDVVGLITTASPAHEAQVERRAESLGWALRSALEADIATQQRLADAHRQSRWLAGTLRFLEHLHQAGDERAMFEAVVGAAAVWGDFDARVYRRELDDHYVLEASLPGVTAASGAVTMPASMFEAGGSPMRISSMAEIEHLGWPSATHEVLAVPLQRVAQPERLLLVAGDLDTGYEQVFAVVGDLLSIRLEALVQLRQAHVRHTLQTRFEQRDLRFNARLAAVLRDASGLVRATEARVLLPDGEGQALRVLAAVGHAAAKPPPAPADLTSHSFTPTRIVLPVARTAFGTAVLDVSAPAGRPFGHDDVALATAAADVIRPWLSGALDALAETGRGHLLAGPDSGFEARIHDEIERAKRLQWPTGLIVVDTQEVAGDLHALALAPVIDALRTHLRSSDLVGRLSDGHLAALLVHTSPRAVAAVAGRVEGELARLSLEVAVPRAAVGKATYPMAGETAAALLAAARADMQHAAVAPA